MKKIVLVFALLFSIQLSAQTKKFVGFMGMQFGSSRELVISTIKQKYPDSKIYQNNPNTLVYENLQFAGRMSAAIIFGFTDDDKLHTCKVMVYAEKEIKLFELYDDVCSEMSDVYGEAKHSIEKFKYPYSANDRGQLTPLKAGYVTMYKMWIFDSYNTPSDENDDDVITINLKDGGYVLFVYQSSKIAGEEVSKNKSKNSKDY